MVYRFITKNSFLYFEFWEAWGGFRIHWQKGTKGFQSFDATGIIIKFYTYFILNKMDDQKQSVEYVIIITESLQAINR